MKISRYFGPKEEKKRKTKREINDNNKRRLITVRDVQTFEKKFALSVLIAIRRRSSKPKVRLPKYVQNKYFILYRNSSNYRQNGVLPSKY